MKPILNPRRLPHFLLCLMAFVFFSFFGLSLKAEDDALEIVQVSPAVSWKEKNIQEVQVSVKVPEGFHAYTDQFRILNLQPDSFKAGQISVSPEVEFYDKFSKKTRKGIKNQGLVKILFESPVDVDEKLEKVLFELRYQICSEKICYLPKNVAVEIPNQKQKGASLTSEAVSGSLTDRFMSSLETNLPLAFLIVFLAGILTSFTPCIFPMLPITISILGYHANRGSRWHNLSRAISYVLGIALTYAFLGLAAALTGNLFGAALSNKYVIGGMCLLFVLMALSMWEFFELQVPAFIRNRFATAKGHGIAGAFVMGLVAGVVASPCVGPVLVSILSFVSTTKNGVLGFTLLFTFALGLGLIFIVIGLFSRAINLLPKSGAWMNGIKFLLGAGMWGAALYYAQFLIEERWWVAVVAASFLAFSVWKGAFDFRKKNYMRQSFLLAVFVFSTTVLLLAVAQPQYLSPAFGVNADPKKSQITWIPYSEEVLKTAIQEEKPVLLDFFAEWCAACHELEERTYSHPEFLALSKQFLLVKFDATADSEANQKILAKYKVKGLPTVMFINKKGDIIEPLTFTQFLTWDELKPKLQEFLK